MRRIALTLHAHLPFYPPEFDVSGPADGSPVWGTHWLLENVIECYLPLLRTLRRLEAVSENKLNISLSPVLLEQLASPRTKDAILDELTGLTERAKSDASRLRGIKKQQAEIYQRDFSDLLRFYLSIKRDIVGEFSRLANVELMTTALTHPFLPLLKHYTSMCAYQITEAARQTEMKLGKRARGFWFPEMGYTPYVSDVVSSEFDYFLVAPSAVPAWEGNSYRNCGGVRYGVVDSGISCSIWHPAPEFGDPSFALSPVYREFHKWEESSGLKYWAITNRDIPLAEKSLYFRSAAERQLEVDVADCLRLLRGLKSDRLLAMDAEFFGHHWYEGSDFLYMLLSQSEDQGVRLVSNSELILDSAVSAPEVEPRESCWGAVNVWMGPGRTREVRIDILKRTEQALSLFEKYRTEGEKYRDMLLNRLLKELVAIQASDYSFAIYTNRAPRYYDKVIAHHRSSFDTLADQIDKPCSYCERHQFLPTLRQIAKINYLFRTMDYRDINHE